MDNRHNLGYVVSTMDIRLLEAFCASVENGSFTAAAAKQRVSQPAVSKQVRSLEIKCGTLLLKRSKKGVAPTTAGLSLYVEGRRLLDAVKELDEIIAAMPRGSNQGLRICASYTIGEYLLPEWIDTFQSISSGVVTELVIGNSEAVLDEFFSGSADLCFIESSHDVPNVERVQVARDQLLLVVGALHKWAHRDQVQCVELFEEPFISREVGSGTRTVAERAFANAGLAFPNPAMELASTGSIKRALSAGHGYALLSSYTIKDDVLRGDFCTPRLVGLKLQRSLDLIKKQGAELSDTAEKFVAMLLDVSD